YMHGHSSQTANTGVSPEKTSVNDVSPMKKVERGYGGYGAAPPARNELTMHSHLYQVEFVNSLDGVQISGDKPLDTYNNYFIGNDSSKWASNCRTYQAVIYKNIYPNIDLR